jgi:methylglutamate dehydrogenase subunit D
MADLEAPSAWRYKGAWDSIAANGRIGSQDGDGISVKPFGSFGAALLIASGERCAELARSVETLFDLTLPLPGRFAANTKLELVWAGPNKWLALSDDLRAAETLSNSLKGLAAVSDQSGSRGVLAISGKKARDLFAKGLALDLHPQEFKPGDTALSSIAHIGVHIWQTDASPTYKLAVARSMAASFWSWLVHAGAEFGLSVDKSSPYEGQVGC